MFSLGCVLTSQFTEYIHTKASISVKRGVTFIFSNSRSALYGDLRWNTRGGKLDLLKVRRYTEVPTSAKFEYLLTKHYRNTAIIARNSTW